MYFLYFGDLLKSNVTFHFKGKEQLTTHIGFILSLGLLAFLINTIINSDFLHKQKPTISIQSNYYESYAEMSFDRENFTIVTKVADFMGISIIDFSYFYFNITFNTFDTINEIAEINNKYMKICEESDFFVQEEKELNLSHKSFCVAHKEPMILQGSIDSNNVRYSIISLNRCDDISAIYYNVTCKNKTEIDTFFTNKFLYLYHSVNKFDLSNFTNPINRGITVELYYIYPQIKKTVTNFIQKTQIVTDSGFIMNSDITSQDTFFFQGTSSDFAYDDKLVHEFFFVSDGSTQIMIRRYQKFQDLLAILGGISSTYLLISNILISNYRKFLLLIYSINHIFSFENLPPKIMKKKFSSKQVPTNKK